MLHRATLSRSDAEQREGFFLTTPLRTLLDVAGAKTVTDEQLTKAVDDALERGLVRESKLEALARKTLGVSHTFLIKQVGEYKTRIRARRAKVLEELAAQAQELNTGY